MISLKEAMKLSASDLEALRKELIINNIIPAVYVFDLDRRDHFKGIHQRRSLFHFKAGHRRKRFKRIDAHYFFCRIHMCVSENFFFDKPCLFQQSEVFGDDRYGDLQISGQRRNMSVALGDHFQNSLTCRT